MSTMYIKLCVFVYFISFTEAGRHLMYFGTILCSGGSYVSDLQSLQEYPCPYSYVLNFNAVFFLYIGQNKSR